MSETIPVLNLGELEERARAVLPQMAYDYYQAAEKGALFENDTWFGAMNL
jgi:hypothetical protein